MNANPGTDVRFGGTYAHGRLRRARHAGLAQPTMQIQITPLIDVLLVLLVLGLLAWAGHRASGRGTPSEVTPVALMQGLTLPLRGEADASNPVTLGEDSLWVELAVHGQLSWRGTPVTRDILAQQLRQAREQDPQAEVWLAIDERLTYADVMPWLEWLQSQHVARLTLLSRSQRPVGLSGKP